MSKRIATLGLAAAAMLVGAMASAPSAEAGHRHWRHHHARIVIGVPTVRYVEGRHYGRHHGCGFEYRKWMNTGSHFWKKQYYVCRGWW